ncbi:MAG: hypothetical protein ACYDAP_10425 [Thermoplasmataceae archaeon]|jgi:hypothetical protein
MNNQPSDKTMGKKEVSQLLTSEVIAWRLVGIGKNRKIRYYLRNGKVVTRGPILIIKEGQHSGRLTFSKDRKKMVLLEENLE